ncbi:zf-DHHC-domain-containing protein [Neoconidiobolus thromboides FSU 785]|nr:zf-DHHC-domain-containing protein [Neoconidiobolus thromboides FSU 785]
MVILIESGADVTLKDTQGFNIVHLSIHSFNLPSLIYSLSFTQIEIDEPDAQGHTPLMWAAYQGFPAAVKILLKNGADVHKRDQTLFTPLHWAVVKGSREIITELILSGSDLKATDDQGKAPKDIANNSKTTVGWELALKLANRSAKTLDKFHFTLSVKRTKQLLIILPLLAMPLFFFTFITLPWAIAILFFLIESFLIFKVILQYVMSITLPKISLNETPMLASVFLTSCLIVFVNYFNNLLKPTLSEFFYTNFVFSCTFAASLYFYFDATLSDPGSIKKNRYIRDKSGFIRNLAKVNMLNNRQFCTTCIVSRPPRSKHCKFCDQCVLKFDHHCPWTYNCIGSNNHRQFILFLILLLVAIGYYEYIGFQYLLMNEHVYIPEQITCFLTEEVCAKFQFDSFTCYGMLWALFQATWLVILLFYQLYLIAKNQTTNESLNHDKYALALPFATGEVITNNEHNQSKGCMKYFIKSGENRNQRGNSKNKYDKGLFGNCAEFWGASENSKLFSENQNTYQEVPLQEINTS